MAKYKIMVFNYQRFNQERNIDFTIFASLFYLI